MAVDSNHRQDFIVKINGEENASSSNNGDGEKFWRESSYHFRYADDQNNKTKDEDDDYEGSFDFTRRREPDPPSKLINQFLNKQKTSGDEIYLDMELNMPELQNHMIPPSNVTATASNRNGINEIKRRENRVKLSSDSSDEEEEENRVEETEIVKCSSRKIKTLTKTKTKTRSRLMDPPTPVSGRIHKSGNLKPGFSGKCPKPGTPKRGNIDLEEEEEDPFWEEDLPEGYKKEKFNFWIIIEWVFLILIITGLICSLVIDYLRSKKLWNLSLWKWEVMVLVLICGRLVSSWIVKLLVYFIESNFLLRKRVLYFVYGIRKAVENCLWLGLVLTSWHFLFDKKVEREARSTVLKYITKVLVCLLIGVIIWLIKTLLVKVLASSFHMSTYFDRIHESLFTQYVIETLSGPPRIEILKEEGDSPTKSPVLSRVGSKKEEDKEGIRIDHLQRMNTKNVSAWKMKRLMKVIRKASLSTLDEQIQDTSHKDDKATHIRSEFEAKTAARKIFLNVAEPGSRYE